MTTSRASAAGFKILGQFVLLALYDAFRHSLARRRTLYECNCLICSDIFELIAKPARPVHRDGYCLGARNSKMQWQTALRLELAAAPAVILPKGHLSRPVVYLNAGTNSIPVGLHPSQVHLKEVVVRSVRNDVLKEMDLPGR